MSITTENYLKEIFAASESAEHDLVSLGTLAQALRVTPGTVTTMMKSLADAGLIEYRPRAGVLLTREGRDVALSVVRRHRLIELFLVEVVGLDWAEVHKEAEVLEHAVSDRLLGRIDELLGYPKTDPHGDPIPTPDGTLAQATGFPLADAGSDDTCRVVRVEHDEPGFLDYLKETGLVPGATITVVRRNDAAGTILVRTERGETVISVQMARKLRVRSIVT
ncbi:MAG: metal-dependent transcriptional regulator [Spirochaetales bacterium]|nr:metal-dependent transcriptional regulator [Spirochaetales bacterium]